MNVTHVDIANNNAILNKIKHLSLSVMEKIISDKDDILYKPESIVELGTYTELLTSIITRRIGDKLGHHNGEELYKKGVTLTVPTSSILHASSIHSAKHNSVDTDIATVVESNIDYIKENIQPIYNTYKTFVTNGVTNRTSTNPLDNFNIHMLDIPDILTELNNRGEFIVNEYDTELIKSNVNIPLPTDGVLNYMKTDIPKLDNLITNMFTDNKQLEQIWNKYLLKTNAYIEFDDVYKLDINNVTAVYLLVRNIVDNLPENIEGVSFGDYTKILYNIKEYLKRKIVTYIKMVDRLTKNKMIVSNGRLTTVTLVGTLYRNYLSNDGDIEIILGALVSGKGTLSIDMLVENRQTYKDKWDGYVKRIKLVNVNNLHLYYREAYDIMFHKVLEELPYGIVIELGDQDALVNKEVEVRQYLTTLTNEEIRDIPKVSEYVITSILFDGYNGDIFLSHMRKYAKSDDTLTPRECASLATLEIIVAYMLTQVNH